MRFADLTGADNIVSDVRGDERGREGMGRWREESLREVEMGSAEQGKAEQISEG